MKFDHLGVVVADISLGRKHFSKIYGINRWTKEYYDEINGVIVQFGEDETGGFCYELIAPIDKRSPIYNALMNRDRILNHVAYLVDDIDYYYNENLKDDFIILAEPKKAIALTYVSKLPTSFLDIKKSMTTLFSLIQ